jgi:hypothetical protein
MCFHSLSPVVEYPISLLTQGGLFPMIRNGVAWKQFGLIKKE